jgi:O-antigen/teichoic acid export membrane protein
VKNKILNLGKDAIVYGCGSAITSFLGLFLLPIFTSYLNPKEYGVIAILALITLVAQSVFSLGLSLAMAPKYFDCDDSINKNKVVWTIFIINITSISILLFLSWLFINQIANMVGLSDEFIPLITLSLIGCSLVILANPFALVVQYEKQSVIYVMVTFTTAIIAIIVSGVTVVFFHWGIKGMVIGQLAGNAANFVIFFFIILNKNKPAISIPMGKDLLQKSLPLIPGFIFLFLLMHGGKFILGLHDGLNDLGIYSIGFNLGMTISIVTGGIVTAWHPFFMNYIKRPHEAEIIFGRIFTYYIFGSGLLSLIYFMAAKLTVMILTNEAFYDSYKVVGLVATGNYFMGMYRFFLTGMYLKNELYMQSIIQGVAFLLLIPIMFFFVIYIGVIGAALSVAIGHFLLAFLAFYWNIYRRNRYISIKYEWRRIYYFSFIYITTSLLFLTISFDTILGNLFFFLMGLIIVIIAIIQLLKPSEIAIFPFLGVLKI